MSQTSPLTTVVCVIPDKSPTKRLLQKQIFLVSQNHLGFGMATLEAPKFPGEINYPANFDCNYTIALAKGDGCFNVILEKGISIENSPFCSADRLEIRHILNGALVTMDNAEDGCVVLCGDG